MRKRFIGTMFMALALAGATSVFTSCKSDYDDDIARLEQKIDQNKKLIDQIETQVTDGSVITSVEKVGNGIVVTLSNGQKYTITNGTDAKLWTIGDDGYWYEDGVKTDYYALGKDGTNGKDAPVWTIGADGYWYKDGVKTTVKAEGKDGTNGAEWTIGADGYWYKNGVKTDFPASVASSDGKDGKDGGYYRPNEYGYFDYCDAEGNVIEPNAVRYASDVTGAVTAVMTDGELQLYGVDGVDGYKIIALSNTLRGLVFQPQAYVDGVPAILMESLNYYPLKATPKKVLDPQDKDVWAMDPNYSATTTLKVVNPQTEAYYHINPKNANFNDLKGNLQFVVLANDEFIVSRPAPASNDFNVTAELDEDYGVQDGVIRVKVNITGEPATKEKISVVALQATKTNSMGEKEDITSDYATIYKKTVYDDLRIAARITDGTRPSYQQNVAVGDDYHYRSTVGAIDLDAGISTFPVVYNDDNTNENIDLIMAYNKDEAIGGTNGCLDLNEFVLTHLLPKPCSDLDMDRFGLHFEYSLVRYQIGQNSTEEEEYVNHAPTAQTDGTFAITNGVLQINNTYKSSALLRTPIVCVKLMHGTDVVKVAYIKVKIAELTNRLEDEYIIMELTDGNVACGILSKSITYKDMSKYVYRDMNMSKKQFHDTYEFDKSYTVSTILADETAKSDPKVTAGDGQTHNTIGTMDEVPGNPADLTEEGTAILRWEINKNDSWAQNGNIIYQRARYKRKNSSNGPYVYITFKMKIAPFSSNFTLNADKMMLHSYWTTANIPNTWFNVRTPKTGENTNTNCLLKTDVTIPFITKTSGTYNGMPDFTLTWSPAAPSVSAPEVVYRFVGGQSGITGTNFRVVDSRSATGNYESYLYDGSNLIATIHNNDLSNFNDKNMKWWIEFNKSNTRAKQLLMNGDLKANITLTAIFCDGIRTEDCTFYYDAAKTISQKYFVALLMKPVFYENTSSSYFQDGVDMGASHSFLPMANVVSPHDWRDVIGTYKTTGQYYPLNNNYRFDNHVNYYGYYGVSTTVSLSTTTPLMVDYLDGTGYHPATDKFVVNIVSSSSTDWPLYSGQVPAGCTSVLTYKNNGSVLLNDASLHVTFTVQSDWGNIEVPVDVPVWNTGKLAPRR